MVITCDQCQARFRLADDKLKPEGTKVRCSKCRHVFTVHPPENSVPVEEAAGPGEFDRECDAGESPAAPPQEAPAPDAGEPAAAFDFGAPAAAAPPSGDEETFSFSVGGAEPGASEASPAPDAALDQDAAGMLDFDTTFAEVDEPQPVATGEFGEFSFAGEAGAGEDAGAFDFAAEALAAASDEFSFAAEPATTAEPEEFSFAVEPATAAEPATEGFSFDAEPAEDGLSEFSFETAAGETPAVAATVPAETFEFGDGGSFETSAPGQEPAFGDADALSWDQPDKPAGPSFDFDEPSFATEAPEKAAADQGGGLSFGEIDFSDDNEEAPPAFGDEPSFARPAVEPAGAPEVPPVPPPAPVPRPAAGRPPEDELPLPAPTARKNPLSRVLLALLLLLLILCGAGAYFYLLGGGDQVVERLVLKLKGEEPAAPTEQRIGLAISGSSYVANREAGQLLVIQGTATNNFAGARSAITVKGVLLDGGGNVLQQQTVFCGNYLSEDKLAGMPYAQIEEAMNNQFGDSLSNMNLKSGGTIRFTIVFRNPPRELANINVEVVDSKPGGL